MKAETGSTTKKLRRMAKKTMFFMSKLPFLSQIPTMSRRELFPQNKTFLYYYTRSRSENDLSENKRAQTQEEDRGSSTEKIIRQSTED
jgi:hypothetical protein